MAKKTTNSKDQKKKKEQQGRIGGKTIILFVFFGISLLPFILAPFDNLFIQYNDYSIFNNGLKGSSLFYYKTIIESHHIPLTIDSSLNALYLLPSKNTILVELNPVQIFDPFEIMTLIEFIGNGGKLLLASNFGSGSELTLLNNLMAGFFVDPMKDALYDLFLNFTLSGFNISKIINDPFFDPNNLMNFMLNQIPEISPKFSYWIENNIYPSSIFEHNTSNSVIFFENLLIDEIPYAIIVDDITSPYDDGVNQILATQATPLNLGLDFGLVGWENLLSEEDKNLFADFWENLTGMTFDIPSTYELTTMLLEGLNTMNISTMSVIAETSPSSWVDTNGNYIHDLMDYNGSFWISALSANKRVIITTQPHCFLNFYQFTNEYDNSKFAMNLLNNLANNTPHFVVFDESKQQKSFPSFFGLILRFLNASSGILLLLPVLPLIIYATLSRWIPKFEKPKIYKKSKIVKTKGKSIFSERMKWFKQKRQYNKAISLLFRRLKRSLIKSLGLRTYDSLKVIEEIKKIKPNVNINRIRNDLKRLEYIEKKQTRITSQSYFLQAFDEMTWIYDQIK